MLSRRLLLVACLVPALAAAQSFPSRPIRLIVPYALGGNTDIVARVYSQKPSERLGQPVVIVRWYSKGPLASGWFLLGVSVRTLLSIARTNPQALLAIADK